MEEILSLWKRQKTHLALATGEGGNVQERFRQ